MGCHTALIRLQIVSTDLNSFDWLKNNFATGQEIDRIHLELSHYHGCGMKFEEKDLEHYPL